MWRESFLNSRDRGEIKGSLEVEPRIQFQKQVSLLIVLQFCIEIFDTLLPLEVARFGGPNAFVLC